MRIGGAYVERGTILVYLGDYGQGRFFAGSELDPYNVTSRKSSSCRDTVCVNIWCHGNVDLAKVRKRLGFELLVDLFGRVKFGNSLCHGSKDS